MGYGLTSESNVNPMRSYIADYAPLWFKAL
jgi:hypothetical protein